MKARERRKFHRINFDGPVNIKLSGESYDSCKVGNLSLTGIFVQGNFQRADQEQECCIQFIRTENSENSYLEMDGEVVWRNKDGMGLRFTSMKHDNYMRLISTLINNAAQPVRILSEIPKSYPFKVITYWLGTAISYQSTRFPSYSIPVFITLYFAPIFHLIYLQVKFLC